MREIGYCRSCRYFVPPNYSEADYGDCTVPIEDLPESFRFSDRRTVRPDQGPTCRWWEKKEAQRNA